MSCYKASDNKYFDCPPRMADARHFTDYRPNCVINNLIRAQHNTKNSFEYRNFLKSHANDLMKNNYEFSYSMNGCSSCKKPYHKNTMLPEKEILDCDKNGCTVHKHDSKGLGQGRNYGKKMSEDHVRPDNASANCCGDSNSLFDYYGNNHNKYRNSVPSGGSPFQKK